MVYFKGIEYINVTLLYIRRYLVASKSIYFYIINHYVLGWAGSVIRLSRPAGSRKTVGSKSSVLESPAQSIIFFCEGVQYRY